MTTLLLATIVCSGVEPSIAPGEWGRVGRGGGLGGEKVSRERGGGRKP